MLWLANVALLLNSFESPADLTKVQPYNTRIFQVEANATHGRFALQIEFQTVQYPNIYFRIGQAFDNGDWREFSGLAVDVTNLESEPIALFIRVDDDFSADGRVHCRTGRIVLPPKRTTTVVMPFQIAIPPGMRGGPPLAPNAFTMETYGSDLDLSHIVAFQLFLVNPKNPVTLIVDNIRLVPKPDFNGIVDKYGQYARSDWKGKVKSDEDFKRQWQEEEEWLKANPPFADRDEFGGWLKGPKLKATGFFRTAYVVDGKETEPPEDLGRGRGRWWLVTPKGQLFFSLGIDCVRYNEGSPLDNREYLFSWLPEPSSPFAQFISHWRSHGYTRWINFYAMNLFRKYGDDWQQKWLDITIRRLLSWGFNTIGNWSSAEVFRARKIPYVVPIHYGAPTSYFKTAWRQMPDVFDERFPKAVEQTIANAVREWKDDPWCIGYFVGNELSWSGWGSDLVNRYDLPRRVLASDGNLPSKREFVRLLRAKYGEVERLNKAWKVQVASWEDLLSRPLELPTQMTDECVSDLSNFLAHFARRYFSVVRDAIKKHAPNQLYLGCRFAPRPMEVVKVAAEFCDVVSFNIYAKTVGEREWSFTNTLGKPCIIGEFHFGALDRGMFHTGLVAVENQGERGRAYQAYVQSVLKLPAFVGCHWFQYVDEPLTGRFDGENYNIGFVSVVDYPYWELVKAAREINGRVYNIAFESN